MTNPPPAIAKLTRPLSQGLYPRERLFALLDEARSGPAVWICGPAGFGKTSLMASYVEARSIEGVWYRVDSGDADVSTLFHYLGLAAKKGRRKNPLPHLTPEYLPGIEVFARRFFEQLFARLETRPAVIVFDDVHEVPAESTFHQLLSLAISEVPPDVTVVMISRNEPPPALARWYADRRMSSISWDELRLLPEEAQGIASLCRHHGGSQLKRMMDVTQGWAAGLVLMLRGHAQGVSLPAPEDESRGAVYDYFAQEIFSKMPEAQRQFFCKTAFIPGMTVRMAEELTGVVEAGQWLTELSRNHFFTERRAKAGEPLFEYHPLVREYLIARAAQILRSPELASLKHRAALLLEGSGQIEAAAALLRDSGELTELIRFICQHAPVLAVQGRNATLDRWIQAIPEELLAQTPWLLYWRGIVKLAFDTKESRRSFEAAHARFKAERDVVGSFLSFSGLIDTYFFDYAESAPMEEWLAELEQFKSRHADFLSPEIEARIMSGLQQLMVRKPDHPSLDAWAERALRLMRSGGDANQRFACALFVVVYNLLRGDLMAGGLIFAEIERTLNPALVSPVLLIEWRIIETEYNYYMAAHEASLTAYRQAKQTAETAGVFLLNHMIQAVGVLGSLSRGDLGGAEKTLHLMQSDLNPEKKYDVAHFYFLKAGLALQKGDLADALRYAQADFAIHSQATTAPFMAMLSALGLAQVYVESKDLPAAERTLKHARRLLAISRGSFDEYRLHLVEAELKLAAHDEAAALEALKAGLRLGREQGYAGGFPWWRPKALSRLCATALEAGIETDYVKHLIRSRALAPPTPEVETWPWPLRLYTLGRFAIVQNGEPLRQSGKAQQRPLEMLKALIALGGRDIASRALNETLWPDAEGDAAKNAFDITLHRLRKLLGRDDAITAGEGKLSINDRVCWVDVWAFDRVESQLESALSQPVESSTLEGFVEKAFALYQGQFLAQEEQPWALARRERLRSRFLRNTCMAAQMLEKTGLCDKAIALYRRGLEEDPLAEELYRRLMACLSHLERPAEALEIYRKCRSMLSIVLGLAPSPETELLRARLLHE